MISISDIFSDLKHDLQSYDRHSPMRCHIEVANERVMALTWLMRTTKNLSFD